MLLIWTYPPLRPWPTSHVEEMEVDYGPTFPPRLGSDLHNASDQNSIPSEEPSNKASDRPKNTHSHKRHNVGPRSASDQYYDESDEPRISSS